MIRSGVGELESGARRRCDSARGSDEARSGRSMR